MKYSIKMGRNLAELDVFCRSPEGNRPNRNIDGEITWYSSSPTRQIFLHGLKHALKIHISMSTWLCLIFIFFLQPLQNLHKNVIIV